MTYLSTMSPSLLSAITATAMMAVVTPAQQVAAEAVRAYRFDLRDMSLDEALRKYAKITNRQILYRSETIGSRAAPDLVGMFDADRALAALLAGAPVSISQVRPGVFAISPRSTPVAIDVPRTESLDLRKLVSRRR